MEAKDRKRALETIGVMLAGFPSSQAGINEVTPEPYLRAVGDCSLPAVEAACAAFLRGEVSGLSFGYRARGYTRVPARNGTWGRVLEDIELIEVSLVTHPLQPGARVHLVR